MSVYRRKLTKEANDFFVFLEQKVLKTPIVSARQFAHGAASQNYHIRLNNQQEILVKLTKSYNKQGITRLTKICQAVSSNKQLPVARLISFQQKPFFQYKAKYGLILEYCQGYAVPSYRINKHHFTQIINAYAVFVNGSQKRKLVFSRLICKFKPSVRSQVMGSEGIHAILFAVSLFNKLCHLSYRTYTRKKTPWRSNTCQLFKAKVYKSAYFMLTDFVIGISTCNFYGLSFCFSVNTANCKKVSIFLTFSELS